MIIVSSCLLGENCKYNGSNNFDKKIADFLKGKEVVCVCPEVAGGLPVPRNPVELKGNLPLDKNGVCYGFYFEAGVKKCIQKITKACGGDLSKIEFVLLQPRSPSCGVGKIYDGTFSGTLVEGNGLFVQALEKLGIKCINADEVLKN